MNYQQKYETLITIINNRLKDNMTVLAARHSLAGILAEAGETNGRSTNSHINGRQEDSISDVERW